MRIAPGLGLAIIGMTGVTQGAQAQTRRFNGT